MRIHIGYGNVSLLYNLILLVPALLIARKNIGAGTIVYALFCGYFIDFYIWILEPFQLWLLAFPARILIHLLGLVLFTAGLAILICFRFGMNAVDAILYKVESVCGVPYFICRTAFDALQVITGFLLGGTFGIGTLLCVLATGTMVKLFVGVFDRNTRTYTIQ